jgi:hypothetical protein
MYGVFEEKQRICPRQARKVTRIVPILRRFSPAILTKAGLQPPIA